jgi:co-chaperonin GroES (HSP10)
MTKLAYQPHQIRREQLKPLKDSVIVSDMVFDARISTGGIIIPNDNGKSLGIRPRWGRVYAVGPDQKDVTVGQWAMVAHGRWTRGIDIEDESGKVTLRRVDPNDIIMITDGDERPADESFSEAIHVEAAPSWMQHS